MMNNLHVDLNLLHLFEVLVSERHVSRAANRVGLSQPAMSHALRKLRQLLNDQILVRKGIAMVPTPAALRLLPAVREILTNSLDLVRGEQNFEPSSYRRTFRLGMTDYASLVILPKLAIALRRNAPNTRIVVTHVGRRDAAEAVKSGEIELAIGAFPRTAGLNSLLLSTERYKCAVWRGNKQIRGKLSLERYLSLPHLLVDAAGEANGVMDIELARLNLQRNIVSIVPHFLVAPSMLRQTDMILTLVERLLRKEEHSSQLRIIDPPLKLPDYRLSMIWDQHSNSDKALEWFRRLVFEAIKKD
jgi:DNA-binding transcriptional LysR family regulator